MSGLFSMTSKWIYRCLFVMTIRENTFPESFSHFESKNMCNTSTSSDLTDKL